MNWPLILMCSGSGILVGFAATFGWMEGFETWVWIVVMLAIALILALKADKKLFMHGFWVAVISTIIAGVIEFAFWDTYLSNNAKLAEAAEQMPEGWSIRSVTMFSLPFIAAMSGAIQGLLALVFGKLLREKKPAEISSPPSE